MQRFGSKRDAPTHLIGRAIFRGEWKTAIELLLAPRRGGTHPRLLCSSSSSLSLSMYKSLYVLLLLGGRMF